MSNFIARPIQEIGIGLRSQHFSYILENLPVVSWFEILIDNFLNEGGPALFNLQRICEHYPIVFHGVGLSLGSMDALNQEYLQKLTVLRDQFQPTWISDHLSWISLNKQYAHQLLPLPYTEEAVTHVAKRIQQVQDYLGQRILVENVSSYLDYVHSAMPEWEFLNAVAQRADCHILLDINNIYVSAKNQNFVAQKYLRSIDKMRVKQFHLAGFEQHENYLLDTHSAAIADDVWKLYASALQHFGAIPTLIEWDANIPKFPLLLAEAEKAKIHMNAVIPRLDRGIQV